VFALTREKKTDEAMPAGPGDRDGVDVRVCVTLGVPVSLCEHCLRTAFALSLRWRECYAGSAALRS